MHLDAQLTAYLPDLIANASSSIFSSDKEIRSSSLSLKDFQPSVFVVVKRPVPAVRSGNLVAEKVRKF